MLRHLLREIADADDMLLLMRGAVLLLIFGAVLIVLAVAAGLAVLVFEGVRSMA